MFWAHVGATYTGFTWFCLSPCPIKAACLQGLPYPMLAHIMSKSALEGFACTMHQEHRLLLAFDMVGMFENKWEIYIYASTQLWMHHK